MAQISCKRHRFPAAIIQHAVWLHFRFTLSFRDVEDLLAERGLDISYESIRYWVLNFGKQGFLPSTIVTDNLPSYGAALRDLGLSRCHDFGGRKNNRAENSHQPGRRRERKIQRFKSAGSAQQFLSVHSSIYNLFNIQSHLISRNTFHQFRDITTAQWSNVVRPA